ncbi:hypothetical protein GMDG_07304 [Pseudogymnoascus destructans 20631-21]|uniref:Uncharacterized protein n=1 Tax=Pseudogymnoascus destructans (strain ATCC MYA-4855 / 20631-21) TaxID=658429 RepID=L8G005_PSED2|nr:hypothetical protein GMDG_07304 [Pseudogymnoascus destructans 20631-21]
MARYRQLFMSFQQQHLHQLRVQHLHQQSVRQPPPPPPRPRRQTSPTTSPTIPPTTPNSSTSKAWISGPVIGSIAVLALIIGFLFYIRKRGRKKLSRITSRVRRMRKQSSTPKRS